MPAYVIFSLCAVHDGAALQRYRQQARPTIGAHGGRAIVARGASKNLEGATPLETVVLEFPDFQRAQDWYYSQDYQEARELRRGAADIEAHIVEGFTPPSPPP